MVLAAPQCELGISVGVGNWFPPFQFSQQGVIYAPVAQCGGVEEASWFSITGTQAPSPNLPRIFSPSSILSLADSTDSAATEKQSRKTRLYPDRKQRETIKLWFDAARWRYNKTIETLRQPGATANWKKIKTSIIKDVPPHLQPAPYQVKSIAVRDACQSASNAKKYNAKLKGDQAQGLRTD